MKKLVYDEQLVEIPLEKPVAYPVDCALLLRTLFQPHLLSTFRKGTDILRAALLINLCIDLCGRIGELLVRTRFYDDEGIEILDESVLGSILTWGRVKFELHQDNPTQPVRVSAELMVKGMKGQKRMPGLFKGIPLSTLTPESAFDDSVRLLLYLAIIEGHLVNERITGLHCLQKFRPGPLGMELLTKESSDNIPVFIDGTSINRP